MITGSNSDVISKQLEEFSKEVERRLKNMVENFSVDIVEAATANTPLGDSEKFANYYNQRSDPDSPYYNPSLPDEEGVARGAWVVGLNGQLTFTPISGRNTGAEAVAEAQMDITAYQLGQDFVIGNAAPYIADLEGGYSMQAPGGIMQPTLAQIQTAHEADLKRYYDAG